MNVGPEARCLDVGCGLGIHSFNMAAHAKEVIGIDQSKKRVEFCSLRAKLSGVNNARFEHTSLDSLYDAASSAPAGIIRLGSSDTILMNGVLEWIPEGKTTPDPRQDQVEALKKLRDLLAPGGTLARQAHDATLADHGLNPGHAQLRSLLENPIHLVRFRQPLHQTHGRRRRGTIGVEGADLRRNIVAISRDVLRGRGRRERRLPCDPVGFGGEAGVVERPETRQHHPLSRAAAAPCPVVSGNGVTRRERPTSRSFRPGRGAERRSARSQGRRQCPRDTGAAPIARGERPRR